LESGVEIPIHINSVMTGEYAGLDREALSEMDLKVLAELEMDNAIMMLEGKSRDERRAALLARKVAMLERLLPRHETIGRLAN